jgi:hypothetical protein
MSSEVQVIFRELIADAENRIAAVEENGPGHGAKPGACRLGSVLEL